MAVLVGVWFFGRVARRDMRTTLAQGVVLLVGAVGLFGLGLSVISLGSGPLVPLGLAIIGLSLAVGTYGARLCRPRS